MRFMIVKHYGPVESGAPPIFEWDPEDFQAHVDFQIALNEMLTESGELVEAGALTPPEQAKYVVSDGSGPPVVTDGPYSESKELIAGYRIVDVESWDRVVEIAALDSAAPGPGGEPVREALEIREFMGAPEA